MESAFLDAHRGVYQPQILLQALSYDLDRPLLIQGDVALSAGQFRERVSQFLQALQSLSLEPGGRIGVLSANRPEVLVLTAACLLGEFVLVPLHPLGSRYDHAYVVEDSAMAAIVVDAGSFAERGDALQSLNPDLRVLHFSAPDEDSSNGGSIDLCHLADCFIPADLPCPDSQPEQAYRLSYSGGTTGKPKAVVGTHRVGIEVLRIQLMSWEWPTSIRQLMCAPLSHAGAAMFLPTLLKGGCMHILPRFDAGEVLRAIERSRINCLMLVPTMIYALLDQANFDDYDLSSLETIFYGASAMSPARLDEGLRRLGPVFFQFYGQVEAPMTICTLGRQEHIAGNMQRLQSCGRPVPWVQVELMDETMNPVDDGEPGEICVSGPLVMSGYHQRPEETAQALGSGCLRTGDIAVRDPGGFLRIVDRRKDMIVSGGFNVYPREVEDVLSAHPAVAACAVVGAPHERWGEVVTALIVKRPACEVLADELQALVRAKKGALQVPKIIHFVDDIPLTAVGKPDKKALRKRLLEQTKIPV